MIDIVTFSLGGRDLYLMDCISSVSKASSMFSIPVNHRIVFQGTSPNREVSNWIINNRATFECWPQNIGIGAGLNKILPKFTGQLIIKLDEDAKFVTQDPFYHIWEIHKSYPDIVFSPFPIGLQNNLGGVKGYCHWVHHNSITGRYYMMRNVRHVGGMARCVPRSIYESYIKNGGFPNDLDPTGAISGSEDGSFSNYCSSNGIIMSYMDTAVVVEHNEGTLSQVKRYPEYFAKRNESKK